MNKIITNKSKVNYNDFAEILQQQSNTKILLTTIDLKTLKAKSEIKDNINCGFWSDDNTTLKLFDFYFDCVRKSGDNCKLIAFYPPTLIYQYDNKEYHITIIF